MTVALQCNRCKTFEPNDDKQDKWLILDYKEKRLGTYWTVHLCPSCKENHAHFMKG